MPLLLHMSLNVDIAPAAIVAINFAPRSVTLFDFTTARKTD